MPTQSLYRLGVLLVHGIGAQPANDTLVRWGDVLIKTIGHATRGKVEATIVHAVPSGEVDDKGGEAVVRLQMGNHTERWLLAEGWWAETFPTPTYGELFSWSVRALPWAIAMHIAGGYWQAVEEARKRAEESRAAGQKGDEKWAERAALGKAIFLLLLALAATPLFIAILGLLLLLGIVPQFREWVLSVQSTLTATVGDSLAFVESPLRAGLIRTRILDRLAHLKQCCECSVVLAHSQGAAAVLDALDGFAGPSRLREAASKELRDATTVVDALVTFGAGTNPLASQMVLAAGLPKNTGGNPVYYAIGALAMAAGTLAWLYWDVHAERTNFNDIALAVGAWLLFVIGYSAVLMSVMWLVKKMAQRWPVIKERETNVFVWTAVPLLLIGMVVFFWYVDRSGLPFGIVSLLLASLLVLFGTLTMILVQGMKDIVTAAVRGPQRVTRWVDLYASHDPVPNGPTRTAGRKVDESVPISNLGSLLADHNSYWRNLDGFVLRIARECAKTASCPWSHELPQPTRATDERAAWRVGFLRLARWCFLLVWVVIALVLWMDPAENIRLPFDVSSWFPPVTGRVALLAAAIVFLAWITSVIVHKIWGWWARQEQLAMLSREEPAGNGGVTLVAIGLVFWMLVAAAKVLASAGSSAVWGALTDPRNLVEALFPAFGFAVLSAWLLLKLKPAPKSAPSASPPQAAPASSK